MILEMHLQFALHIHAVWLNETFVFNLSIIADVVLLLMTAASHLSEQFVQLANDVGGSGL